MAQRSALTGLLVVAGLFSVECGGSGVSTVDDVIGLGERGVSVAAGFEHTCASVASGEMKCWGRNQHGQLGDGTTQDRARPVAVAGLGGPVAAISAGASHTCAVTVAGAAKCWGANFHGQLGNGSTQDSTRPVEVVGLGHDVTSISAGAAHTCAVTSGGAVRCWGQHFFGQLGDGTGGTLNDISPTPVEVAGLGRGVRAVVAGASHTCALTEAGTTACWGNQEQGQLGDGTSGEGRLSAVPVDAIGLEGVVALASHGNHSCALTSGGGVMCWGSSDAGQLGVGVAERLRASSVTVAGLEENIAAVTAGSFHTCVLTEAGGVRCWGDNRLGQLGDGTSGTSRPAPVDVVGLEQGMAAIAAGGEHTCALTEDGILTCWGDNRYGQLGNGTGGEGNFSPTPVGLRTGE